MRKYVSEEKGYALLVVLLTIVIASLLIVPLISSALSSAVQVESAEKEVKAENIRDYSQRYYRQFLAAEIKETIALIREERGNETVSERELFSPGNFISYLNDVPLTLDGFSTSMEKGVIDNISFTAVSDEINPYLDVEVRYTGIFEGRESIKTEVLRLSFPGLRKVNNDFSSDIERIEHFYNDKSAAAVQYNRDQSYTQNFHYAESVLYQETMEISGHSQTSVQGNFENDLYMEGDMKYSQNDKIRVKGNMYYSGRKKLRTFPGEGRNKESYLIVGGDILLEKFNVHNNSSICVKGNVYHFNTNNQIEMLEDEDEVHKLNTAEGESCEDSSDWIRGKINYMGEIPSGSQGESSGIRPEAGWQISTLAN